MPPAPGHRKARTGCARCKRRKVKCDETKPKCSDCKRHNASCIYNQSVAQSRQQLEPNLSTTNLSSLSNERRLDAQVTDAALELRLMHEWTAFVCHSISTDWEYWYYKAPIVAFKFRHVMDAILSLTALYASRQPLQKTVDVRGHVVPIHQSRHENEEQMTLSRMWIQHPYRTRQSRDPVHSQDVINDTGDISRHDSTKMLATSRTYFDRAIEGHRRSLDDLNLENIEAAFVTSILVSFIALFTFHEPEEESSLLPPLDPILWVQLSGGTRMVCRRWAELAGDMWMVQSGAFYGEPDLSDDEELFREQHAEPFWKLLTHAQEYENMSNTDRGIYQQSLSYLGLMYKHILEGSEPPLASCRRFIALPARLPDSFNQRLEQKQPRATVILAYAFAVISFIGPDVPWFEGIAEAQIPKMNSDLPSGWQTMMKWPMAVAAGELSKENADYHLRETLGDMVGQ